MSSLVSSPAMSLPILGHQKAERAVAFYTKAVLCTMFWHLEMSLWAITSPLVISPISKLLFSHLPLRSLWMPIWQDVKSLLQCSSNLSRGHSTQILTWKKKLFAKRWSPSLPFRRVFDLKYPTSTVWTSQKTEGTVLFHFWRWFPTSVSPLVVFAGLRCLW